MLNSGVKKIKNTLAVPDSALINPLSKLTKETEALAEKTLKVTGVVNKAGQLVKDNGPCTWSYTNRPLNSFNFEVIYRPKDLIIEQNAGNQQRPAWDSIASLLRTYDYFYPADIKK